MGNIYVSDSFEDIWNNKKYRRLRKDRFLDVCQTCGANSDLNKLENHIEPHLFLEMHKQLPKISVIIPINRIFNNFSKVMLALLDQTYPVWEAIIVCNDESENSIRNLLDCKDNRIRIIKSKNKEFYSSLNDGLKNASGKYFCYMTLSNLFRPDKLETQYKEFEKLDNNYALIYLSNLKRNVDPNSLNSEAIDMDSVIIRMEAIKRLGGFNLSACDPGEDLIIRLKDQGYLTKSIQTEWTTNLAKYFVSKAENNLLQDNDPGKAILTFKMAIEEDPFLIEAFNNIGVIYAYYHKYDEALEYLNKALELDPGYRKAIISIGEINRVLGKLDKAHSLYAGYLEENSNDLEIKELLECLN
jgi:glycosyltransferase involved in cell wall biosynthesis